MGPEFLFALLLFAHLAAAIAGIHAAAAQAGASTRTRNGRPATVAPIQGGFGLFFGILGGFLLGVLATILITLLVVLAGHIPAGEPARAWLVFGSIFGILTAWVVTFSAAWGVEPSAIARIEIAPSTESGAIAAAEAATDGLPSKAG